MRRVSTKRRKETARRQQVLAEVAVRDGTGCFALRVHPHTCEGPIDGHELRSRAQYPGGHLDASNVILVCRASHRWITDHPVRAFELGLIRSAKLAAQRLADAERDYHDAKAAHHIAEQS